MNEIMDGMCKMKNNSQTKQKKMISIHIKLNKKDFKKQKY
jgi:hypothetical protein